MNLLENLISEPNKRKSACEKDFFLFCKTYFPHYFSCEPAAYHRILMNVVSSSSLTQSQINQLAPLIKPEYHKYMSVTEKVAGIIDVEPRGFSKSTRFSLAFPLWVTLYKKKNFPILFASSQRQAEANLETIRDEIDENEVLFEDFGEMRGSVWKSDKITLANGTAIAARGAGASTRGIKHGPYRPDVAICDDIMTDEIARTKAQRDKRYRWLKRVVFPLGQDILPVLINTIFHEDDIVCRLLDELTQGQLKDWVGFRFSAVTPSGTSLWPSYWSNEKLAKKQDELGSAAFSTEMMNEPISSEDAIVKNIHTFKLSELGDFTKLPAYGGIDPATGAHDHCAFVTLIRGDDGVLYCIDSWGKRLHEPEFLQAIIDTFMSFHHACIGFEDVAFQGIYKNNLIEKAVSRGVWLPIVGRKAAGMSKQARVRKMAPLIEAGLIRFQASQKELLEQLSMMSPEGPKSAYDDLVDALYYAFETAQEGRYENAPIALVSATNTLKTRPSAQFIINKIRRTS